MDDISFDGYEDVLVGTQGLNNDGRFFALCGGIPGVGIAGYKDMETTGISIYPRISRTHFSIILGRAEIQDVSIYDAAGRLVRRYLDISDDTDHIDWYTKDGSGRDVAQGIYFVRLVGKDFERTEKVVVVR